MCCLHVLKLFSAQRHAASMRSSNKTIAARSLAVASLCVSLRYTTRCSVSDSIAQYTPLSISDPTIDRIDTHVRVISAAAACATIADQPLLVCHQTTGASPPPAAGHCVAAHSLRSPVGQLQEKRAAGIML